VLCAAAKGVWEQKCALVDATSTERTLYEQIKAGTASGGTLGTSTVAISSSSFSTVNALGVAGACIADRNLVVWGHSVTLSFSSVCPYLAYLGILLQAVSFLVAMAIVFRR
jgi:hypothetical protein